MTLRPPSRSAGASLNRWPSAVSTTAYRVTPWSARANAGRSVAGPSATAAAIRTRVTARVTEGSPIALGAAGAGATAMRRGAGGGAAVGAPSAVPQAVAPTITSARWSGCMTGRRRMDPDCFIPPGNFRWRRQAPGSAKDRDHDFTVRSPDLDCGRAVGHDNVPWVSRRCGPSAARTAQAWWRERGPGHVELCRSSREGSVGRDGRDRDRARARGARGSDPTTGAAGVAAGVT